MSFIVEHLNKDAQCIMNLGASNMKETISSHMSLVNFITSETVILQKAELETKCETLEASLFNLQLEHKLLIEQQVASEEAMLDELATLMAENEKLKKGPPACSSSSDVHELCSLVQGIEDEMISKSNLESILANLRKTIQEQQSELQLKAETIACNGRTIFTLQEKLFEIEQNMNHERLCSEKLINELKSQIAVKHSNLEEEERKRTNLQDELSIKDSQLESVKMENSLLALRIEDLNILITAKDECNGKLNLDLQLSKDESCKRANEVKKLTHDLEFEHHKHQEQNEKLKQMDSLKSRFSSLEEAQSCLLDIVKEKDVNLSELQSRLDCLTKEQEENELRVRELISINAELLDSVEASKRLESLSVNKENQIVALQQALSESQKLSELRESELERIRQEKEALKQQVKEFSQKCSQFDAIQAQNTNFAAEFCNLKEVNETLQQRLASVEELKASSKSEVILKIEIEKLKELLSRERKLNELKTIDLEEQIEGLREELTRAKLAEERRLSLMPGKDNDTENLDPFKEAKDKLALLSSTTEVSQINRVQQAPGAPPQECLQQ